MSVDIGVCLAAFADRPLSTALDEVAGLGIDVVDLPTDSTFVSSRDIDSDDLGPVRELLDQRGIRVACVSNSRDAQLVLGPHGPHTDAICAGDAARKRAHGEAAARATIHVAAALGAPLVRLFLGCGDHARWLRWPGSEVSWDDNVAAFVDAATPMCEEAEQHGTRLCIEPHVKQVAFDARSTMACVDGVRRRGAELALCVDPANIAAIHHDPVDFLDAVGLVPACVHVKDVELSSGALPPDGPGWVAYGPHPAIRFRAMPWGQVDWRAVITRLVEMGYSGPLMIEHEDVLIEPVAGITHALAALREMSFEAGPGTAWW